MVNAVDNIHRNPGRRNLLHPATIVKRKVFRKGLSDSRQECERGSAGQFRR